MPTQTCLNSRSRVEREYIMGVGYLPTGAIPIPDSISLNRRKGLPGTYLSSASRRSGYENEENYLWLEKEGRTTYIKPLTYEKWKKEKLQERDGRRETYLSGEAEPVTLRVGRILCMLGKKKKASSTGYTSHRISTAVRLHRVPHFAPMYTLKRGNICMYQRC